MPDTITKRIEYFEKLMDAYIKFAGKWHDANCLFPTIDQAVCVCNLSKNKKIIKSFVLSLRTETVDIILGEIEKEKWGDCSCGKTAGLMQKQYHEKYDWKQCETLIHNHALDALKQSLLKLKE